MKATYKSWLEQQDYASGTVQTQVTRARRVEECYGDLDEHYDQDQLQGVIAELRYSTGDERRGRPNPSKIPFEGNIRNNLASYRNAVERYCKFRRETKDEDAGPAVDAPRGASANETADDRGQLVGLERDLQAALRRAIGQLEPGLGDHRRWSGTLGRLGLHRHHGARRTGRDRRHRIEDRNRAARGGCPGSELHG